MNNFFSIVTMQNFAYCNFLKWKTILNCDYTDFFLVFLMQWRDLRQPTNQPTNQPLGFKWVCLQSKV